MTKTEFEQLIKQLGLTYQKLALLLSVQVRTVQRWAQDPSTIPGPAEQALNAWLQLHQHHLPWGPSTESFSKKDRDQIDKQREHDIDLAALLQRVEKRGGPATLWEVNYEEGRATSGSLEVSFYKLHNGSFSPSFYRRTDHLQPNMQRDWHLIEDAFACIAEKTKLKNTKR